MFIFLYVSRHIKPKRCSNLTTTVRLSKDVWSALMLHCLAIYVINRIHHMPQGKLNQDQGPTLVYYFCHETSSFNLVNAKIIGLIKIIMKSNT